ncbi:MAG: hypothetical protein QNJ36_19815 [Calothrix sp. MO_167.B42]|nr:hypothetical protein [Calothrix sp. MO_167.B42]
MPGKYKFLKRLELGVFFFCWRRSLEAAAEGKEELAATLKQQAQEEYSHAQIFGCLVNSPCKWPANTFFKSSDSIKCGSSLDGISKRYWMAKLLFGFAEASTYSWEDTLAFMAVLESFQSNFYQQLWQFLPPQHKDIIRKITSQELDHSIELRNQLTKMVGLQRSAQLLNKWNFRLHVSLIFLPIDVLGILVAVVMTRIKNYVRGIKSFN